MILTYNLITLLETNFSDYQFLKLQNAFHEKQSFFISLAKYFSKGLAGLKMVFEVLRAHIFSFKFHLKYLFRFFVCYYLLLVIISKFKSLKHKSNFTNKQYIAIKISQIVEGLKKTENY